MMPAAVLSLLVKTEGAAVAAAELKKLDRTAATTGKTFDRTADSTGKHTKMLGGLATAAKYGGLAVGGGLVVGLTKSISAFQESERIGRQTTAVLKSTGGAANVTKKQVEDLATAISRKTGIDDEAVQSSENLLLTFTKVRNEAGRGNNIFTQATKIVQDMSVALGQDGKSSAIQLGKALNDPIKGVTALQRVGVSFTQQQRDQIKALENSGQHLRAQKMILHELNTEFGGSAVAAGSTFTGSINKAKNAVGNLGEVIGGALAPSIARAANKLAIFVNQIQDGTGAGGRFAAQMRQTAKALHSLLDVLLPVANAIASVTRWLARASANMSLFVEDVIHGTHQTGSFGATVHDVAQTLGRFIGIVLKVDKAILTGLTAPLRAAAHAAGALKDAIGWLIDHIPSIPKFPHINVPFVGGSPRGGVEKKLAQMNAGGVPFGTMGKAVGIARKFGLRISSGYRTPAHNRAVGGVEGSLHTHGTPGNPGAIDLVGPAKNMYAAEAWAREHLNLKELLVHNVGSGLHLHLGFGSPRRGAEKRRAMANAAGAGSYGFRQLEQLWVDAGGNPSAAAIMAHIALAESSGNPSAHNPSGATGLWQILGNPFPGNAYNPLTNAKMAIAKSGNGRNLHPWDASRASWGRFVGSATGGGIMKRGRAAIPKIKPERLPSLSKKFLARHRKIVAKQQKQADLAATKRAGAIDRTVNNPWVMAAINHISNLVAAGKLDPIVGRDMQANIWDNAVKSGQLTGDNALIAQGNARDLRMQNLMDITGAADTGTGTGEDPNQPLIDAENAAAEAARQQTEAMNALKEEIKRQTDFATSVANTESAAMARWVTEVISKQMGFGISGRGQTPGYGVARRS